MELSLFIDLVSEQYDDAPVLTPDTKYKELDGWTSIVALSIIAMVDEEFDVAIKGDDIRSTETIGQLFNRVTELCNE